MAITQILSEEEPVALLSSSNDRMDTVEFLKRVAEHSGSSGSEEESVYPLGYYDDSDDDCEETGGHLAFPNFSTSQSEQVSTLSTGSQDDFYGCGGGALSDVNRTPRDGADYEDYYDHDGYGYGGAGYDSGDGYSSG
ncbi:hypothetical protein CYMTET_9684 [Cymbomonas tetramitiformis]|uniref:Uncharacterized protein n=1 Tax=Cymbomonas tetramitiformis TaxID=36881 RepID=A0AAE0LF76_9CHLO|nr:hypothetical protein CYMTET_9684 [Cymbomonas tetramitiformis]